MNNEIPGYTSDIRCVMNVTLEELYNGAVRKIGVRKFILCDACNGRGTEDFFYHCARCSGGGLEAFQESRQNIINIRCRLCDGHGHTNRCKRCNGKMFSRDRLCCIEVDIKKGMFDGQNIVFRGEGNQKKEDLKYGDLIITLNELEHSTFHRYENDLRMTMKISLTESLCGFQRVIKTLDNRQLIVKSECGKIYDKDVTKQIMHEGMPIYKSQTKGRLIIHFDEVTFPKKFPYKFIPVVEKILPHREILPASIVDAEDVEMIDMETAEEHEANKYRARNQHDEEEYGPNEQQPPDQEPQDQEPQDQEPQDQEPQDQEPQDEPQEYEQAQHQHQQYDQHDQYAQYDQGQHQHQQYDQDDQYAQYDQGHQYEYMQYHQQQHYQHYGGPSFHQQR